MRLFVDRHFETAASPDAVFGFLSDFRNAEIWDPGTVTCELTKGEVGEGAEYRNVSEFLGRRTELTYVTEVYQPPRRVVFAGHNASFQGRDKLTINPQGDGLPGSRIHYRAEFDFKGWSALAVPVVAVYLPFLARKTIDHLQATLNKLPAV